MAVEKLDVMDLPAATLLPRRHTALHYLPWASTFCIIMLLVGLSIWWVQGRRPPSVCLYV